MTMACPRCGGNQLQNIKMLYESGTSNSTSTGYGVSVDSYGNMAQSQYVGTTTTISNLAKRFAPPEINNLSRVIKNIIAGVLVFISGLAIFVAVDLLGGSTENLPYETVINSTSLLLLILGLIIIIYWSSKQSAAIKADDLARDEVIKWSKKVVCHSCGEVTEVL